MTLMRDMRSTALVAAELTIGDPCTDIRKGPANAATRRMAVAAGTGKAMLMILPMPLSDRGATGELTAESQAYRGTSEFSPRGHTPSRPEATGRCLDYMFLSRSDSRKMCFSG